MSNPTFNNFFSSTRLFVGKVALTAATVGILTFGLGNSANAGVISASSSSFDHTVNLVVSVPILGLNLPLIFGPIVDASAPPNDSETLLNAVLGNGVLTAALLNATATTNFVPGGDGNAFASATINNLAVTLAAIGTSLSATVIQSTAQVVKTNGVTTPSGTTTLAGVALVAAGVPIGPIAVNPAPNTVLFNLGGIMVVLNEQIVTSNPGMVSILVNAIHISFTNAPFGQFVLLNGDIILAQSQAALVVAIKNISEPHMLLLFSLGLVALGFYSKSKRYQKS